MLYRVATIYLLLLLLFAPFQIGRVQLDLTSLMLSESGTGGGAIAGWFPIFDTLRGIRGSLHVTVKCQFLSNWNEYRTDSAGLRFFASTAALACYGEIFGSRTGAALLESGLDPPKNVRFDVRNTPPPG